jgi:hypothetical protein
LLVIAHEQDFVKRHLGPDFGFEQGDKDLVSFGDFILLACDFDYREH